MFLAVLTLFLSAGAPVFGVFKQTDAGLAHFVELRRTGVTEELDLVIAMGSPKALSPGQTSEAWWNEDRKIGLFLQEKMRPERVYLLGIKAGFPDCAARIERVTATDSVISCQAEKPGRHPNQKWVYDVRAKGLLAQFSYQPFAMYRAFPSAGGVVFVGSDTQRLVAVEYKADREPAFRVLGEAETRPWIARVQTTVGTEGMEARRVIYIENDKAPPPAVLPPLPQTTYDQFAAARPRRVKDGYSRAGIDIQDSIGPWQREDGRIWIGKTFMTGRAAPVSEGSAILIRMSAGSTCSNRLRLRIGPYRRWMWDRTQSGWRWYTMANMGDRAEGCSDTTANPVR